MYVLYINTTFCIMYSCKDKSINRVSFLMNYNANCEQICHEEIVCNNNGVICDNHVNEIDIPTVVVSVLKIHLSRGCERITGSVKLDFCFNNNFCTIKFETLMIH